MSKGLILEFPTIKLPPEEIAIMQDFHQHMKARIGGRLRAKYPNREYEIEAYHVGESHLLIMYRLESTHRSKRRFFKEKVHKRTILEFTVIMSGANPLRSVVFLDLSGPRYYGFARNFARMLVKIEDVTLVNIRQHY